MPTARVNDIDIFYQVVGPAGAEPLVLIMGWGGDHTAWAFQVPALSQHHRVVLFDNRGAGQTSQPDIPYTIPAMASDTLGLLDALGIGSAHICGLSMGGIIAQEIALSHPARVRTLQLHCTLGRLDAWLGFRGEGMRWIRSLDDREGFARMLLPWVLSPKTFNDRSELVEVLLARALDNPYPTSLVGLTRQAQAMEGYSTLDRLGTIRVPTLITAGADDIMVPLAFSRELHALIPGAELVTIPDAGHLHMIEQPERFNATVLDFLARHRGRRADGGG